MTTPIVFLDTDRLTRECSYCGAAFTVSFRSDRNTKGQFV